MNAWRSYVLGSDKMLNDFSIIARLALGEQRFFTLRKVVLKQHDRNQFEDYAPFHMLLTLTGTSCLLHFLSILFGARRSRKLTL